MTDHNKVNVLGVGINPISMNDALQALSIWIRSHHPTYVCVTPAHSIMDAYHDTEFRRILNSSGLTTPDGMSVAWILRFHGYKNVERVPGSALMLNTCQFGLQHHWRHFFYGGGAGVAEQLANRLIATYPDLRVGGTYTPPFRALTTEEDESIIEAINNSDADIVWIGLSSPKQERWMIEHLGRIHAPVMIGVGAAFDFVSGNKPRAPRFMQQIGLEWLFRLASEPRRLWPRYRQYPHFAWLVLLQLLGLKQFPIE
jgi:N-acetylglucosaminyldiphosphoundecaprenol N-acetyl-beta-D-mannosaminyltransferase